MTTKPTHTCKSCRHIVKEIESWELPNFYWYACSKRPNLEESERFPFKKTTCKLWESKVPRSPGSLLLEKV